MNSDKLKHWYGARAEIGRILDGIKQAISAATTEDIRPEGKASSLLRPCFLFRKDLNMIAARDTHLAFLIAPQMKTENGHPQI